jgi:3-oxoacyl-[acyl-carrier protein] reductase
MNTIVTGAASGIGRGLVDRLSRENHTVWGLDLDSAGLERSALEGAWADRGVRWRVFDVRQAGDWEQVVREVVDQAGSLDVLFNVAGVVRPEFAHELTPQNIQLQFDVNATGLVLGCQAAAAVMARQRQGHIVNIASLAGIAPIRGISIYSATKFAVRGFSLAIAQELEPLGIAVSVVCPDAVDTPMVDYQLHFPQAAMTFSGPRILTTEEVVRTLVERVLVERPVEWVIPSGRAWQARLASLLPARWMRWYSEKLSARGRQTQQRLQATLPTKGRS